MAQTNLMRADEIAAGFNSVVEREYWRAAVAGTRTHPEVHFNSRASMVCVSYRIVTSDFAVTFSKTSCAFGDYLASAYRSLAQVLTGLKAAGLPFETVLHVDAVLRIEYDDVRKATTIHIARMGDDWQSADPMSFKVPERNNIENALPAIDGL